MTPSSSLKTKRADFPLLARQINGRPVTYLDSAATTLKPQRVIDAVTRFYTEYTANVHRAVHQLSEEATEAFEGARERVARFIGADSREVAFVRNATEALNVVAHSLREAGPVALPISEHHSNMLPWRDRRFAYIEITRDGEIDLDGAKRVIRELKPVLLTFSSVSNALGVRAPVRELLGMARDAGAATLIDISQSVGHEPLDVRELDCDFACFSGHKLLGPGGVGVLYQRENGRFQTRPLLTGGAMNLEAHREGYVEQPFPWKLEAGTPNVEGVLGLAAACDYLDECGLAEIQAHDRRLTTLAREGLSRIPGVTLRGAPQAWGDTIVSFTVQGAAAHGVARVLSNRFAVMVRSGFHCAQPLHEALGGQESVRLSTHLYNSVEDIERFLEGVKVARTLT